jgi:ribosome biogenesis GTPase
VRGTVIEVSTGLCRVEAAGRSLLCSVRGSMSAAETGYTNVVAVGDEVIVAEDGAQQGVVEQVLPRRTVLARPDVYDSHLRQAVVANADQLLIVAAWREPHIWLELIDRYLITAELNRLTPVICVNKVDLADNRAVCRASVQPYLDLGHRVLFTSAVTGEGIDDLRGVLLGKTSVLAGLSGVGKSTLLSAVQPGLRLRIQAVSADSGMGQHTTSQASMWKLDGGGYVVDTPGIREFGLSDLRRAELVHYYPEIEAVAPRCRFRDCAHLHEPGCAIPEAAARGLVADWRYKNYRKLYKTLPE